MPTIRIDDEVFAALQSRARAFVDTPNDVIRRELGLDRTTATKAASVGPSPSRGRKGTLNKTPEAEFRIPLLAALEERGGRASVAEVLEGVDRRMRERLLPDDFGTLPSTGEPRWENNVKWARKHMIDEGLLSPDAGHGFWEITDRGRQLLRGQ